MLATDPPVIVKTKQIMAGREGVMSLAQGIVHWQPPQQALNKAMGLLKSDPSINGYGPADGLPDLRDALRHKIATTNGLVQVSHAPCHPPTDPTLHACIPPPANPQHARSASTGMGSHVQASANSVLASLT